MTKRSLNLIYNPTALCAVKSDGPSFTSSQIKTVAKRTQEPIRVMETILANPFKSKILLTALKRLEALMQKEIPLATRPELFKQMNHMVTKLYKRFPQDQQIFMSIFNSVTALKLQIDHQPQTTASLVELEWIELEKAVYHLCDWEEELQTEETTSNHHHNK